jgi:hypothetical protein
LIQKYELKKKGVKVKTLSKEGIRLFRTRWIERRTLNGMLCLESIGSIVDFKELIFWEKSLIFGISTIPNGMIEVFEHANLAKVLLKIANLAR